MVAHLALRLAKQAANRGTGLTPRQSQLICPKLQNAVPALL